MSFDPCLFSHVSLVCHMSPWSPMYRDTGKTWGKGESRILGRHRSQEGQERHWRHGRQWETRETLETDIGGGGGGAWETWKTEEDWDARETEDWEAGRQGRHMEDKQNWRYKRNIGGREAGRQWGH